MANFCEASISTCDFKVVKGCGACFEAKVILGPDLSQGWTCLRAGLVQALWGQTCLRAGLVWGPDLSKHFGGGGVQKLQGRKCLAVGSVQKFRAGSVSRPEMSQSLGPEVSRGRTWFAAGRVLELYVHCTTVLSKI